jgi:hypothetical protein
VTITALVLLTWIVAVLSTLLVVALYLAFPALREFDVRVIRFLFGVEEDRL